jgi:hypothetical protein
MSTPTNKAAPARNVRAEVRQIRDAGRRIAASRVESVRFLASTGMHKSNGQVKPRFK